MLLHLYPKPGRATKFKLNIDFLTAVMSADLWVASMESEIQIMTLSIRRLEATHMTSII